MKKRLTFALLALHAACGGARPEVAHSTEVLRGTVIEDGSREPVSHARVVLCARLSDAPPAIGAAWPHCDEPIDETASDDHGAFSTTIRRSVASTLHLIVRDSEHVATVVSGSASTLRKRAGAGITLSRAATVDGHVTLESGEPAVDAGFGFAVDGSHGLVVQHVPCCTGKEGSFTLSVYDLSASEAWLFALTKGEQRLLAGQRIALTAGKTVDVKLIAKDPLFSLRGAAMTVDGKPLTGLVTAEMVKPTHTVLDRALLRLQGGETDPAGLFAFYLAHPATLTVGLHVWNGDHSRREVARERVSANAANASVELRAHESAVVTCTLLDGERPVPLDELSLEFGEPPPGQSPTPAYAGGPASTLADAVRSTPTEVRFAWPQGAESVIVGARGTATDAASGQRDLEGGYVLRNASDVCRVPAARSQR